nr:uncharacterized protein LOC109745348 [Aegilops tauschii subsp. strangulata]
MDFDASPDEEYGPTELDQMIQDEFFDSSNSDEEVDMIMLMSMQEEMDRQGVEAHNDYFKLRRDCCGQLSFSAKQKCTAAMRMLALGTAADAVGEMARMGESTCLKTTVKFARVVVEVFGSEYLREQNAQDTEKLLAIGEARGFPGMLGSIDCMHCQWKNYPKGLRECIKVTPERPPSY